MPNSLAVAVIHGVGSQPANFAQGIINELKDRFADDVPRAQRQGLDRQKLREELVCQAVHWATLLPKEQELYRLTQASHSLDWG